MLERKKKKSPRSKAIPARSPRRVSRAPKRAKPKKEARTEETALSVFDMGGKAVGKLELDAALSGKEPVHRSVVYQALLMYRAGEREGTASTKDRGHVSGGGRKPWRQKGTGQARHGSRRSPIWRGGGVTFGPSPRDYAYSLPLQMKRRAVLEVLKDKAAKKKLILVDRLEIKPPKTKEVARVLDIFKLRKPLFLTDEKNPPWILAARNLRGVAVKSAKDVNALDIASHRECLMTKDAYTGLLKRLQS
ncbi:MAG: 50S ribosomal protein L4 [Candidatus Omnitrophica bacterium]|nr:50S ribosomal protein L4 [Candidatus Omnitrophota bacterium]